MKRKRNDNIFSNKGQEYTKEQVLSMLVEAYETNENRKKGHVQRTSEKYGIDYVTFLRWKFKLNDEY